MCNKTLLPLLSCIMLKLQDWKLITKFAMCSVPLPASALLAVQLLNHAVPLGVQRVLHLLLNGQRNLDSRGLNKALAITYIKSSFLFLTDN
ncbi:hypothetical protein ACFX2I_034798 [Malus domestica]